MTENSVEEATALPWYTTLEGWQNQKPGSWWVIKKRSGEEFYARFLAASQLWNRKGELRIDGGLMFETLSGFYQPLSTRYIESASEKDAPDGYVQPEMLKRTSIPHPLSKLLK